ncbi:MAG: ABC transporter ATP-binding protein, partial [Pseudorhodoplanes sp.]
MAPHVPADSESSYQLIRRLVTEYGAKHWKSYTIAFLLMAISAAGTALIAYLMGTIVNKAYVDRSFAAIVVIGLISIVIFCTRGAATYFQAVIMSRIGNAII